MVNRRFFSLVDFLEYLTRSNDKLLLKGYSDKSVIGIDIDGLGRFYPKFNWYSDCIDSDEGLFVVVSEKPQANCMTDIGLVGWKGAIAHRGNLKSCREFIFSLGKSKTESVNLYIYDFDSVGESIEDGFITDPYRHLERGDETKINLPNGVEFLSKKLDSVCYLLEEVPFDFRINVFIDVFEDNRIQALYPEMTSFKEVDEGEPLKVFCRDTSVFNLIMADNQNSIILNGTSFNYMEGGSVMVSGVGQSIVLMSKLYAETRCFILHVELINAAYDAHAINILETISHVFIKN